MNLLLLARLASADPLPEVEERTLVEVCTSHDPALFALRADCDGGKFYRCVTLGSLLDAAGCGMDVPEAQEVLGRACVNAALGCSAAARSWHPPYRPSDAQAYMPMLASQRQFLAIGCSGADAVACVDLGAAWQVGADASVDEVEVALAKACHLDHQWCADWAITLLAGTPSDVRQGLAELTRIAGLGDKRAIAALIAVRWGGRQNLPADLPNGCLPDDCPALAARLAAGP